MDDYPFLVEKLLQKIVNDIFVHKKYKEIINQPDYIYIILDKCVLRMSETISIRFFEFNIKAGNTKIYFQIKFNFLRNESRLFTSANNSLILVSETVNQNLLHLLVGGTNNIFLQQKKSSMVS